jgi:holo-[acyl-carrier protein] synthase
LTIHLGTDIVYIPRIQGALDRFGERFVRRVYTPAEQRDCNQLQGNSRSRNGGGNQASIKRFAGRWAAKEAVVKALGTGWQGIRYTDVEIQRQLTGVPQVCLHGAAAALVAEWGQCQWQVSISHDGEYCTATALAFCSWI